MSQADFNIADIQATIAQAGLDYHGALHSDSDIEAGTIVLVGFTGNLNWPAFARSLEAADGEPDPLDRWSRRMVGGLAAVFGATALFPFAGPPFLPFQRWAQLAEPVRPSPLGILIHPDWGLWHAYRGALAFREHLDFPQPDRRSSPCETCVGRPCLTACPVAAFTPLGYDVSACIGYLESALGGGCLDEGCRARSACPVGAEHRYGPDQARFHLTAFTKAQRPG